MTQHKAVRAMGVGSALRLTQPTRYYSLLREREGKASAQLKSFEALVLVGVVIVTLADAPKPGG